MSKKEDVLTTKLNVKDLELGVFTPRKSFDQKYIDDLAESIKHEGQQKPIICRPHPEKSNVYQVIDGEHRVRAVRKLERSLIRAEVKTLSDEEAMYLALYINQIHGKRLELMEEALHIKRMIDEQKLTQQDIASKFKRSQTWVSRRLSLIDSLSDGVKDKIMRRRIKTSHAVELVSLPEEKQDKLASFVEKQKPNIKETRFLVGLVKEQPSKAQELLEKDKDHLRAEMKHEEVIETAVRFDELIRSAKEPWQEEHVCVNCGFKFKINWEEGTIQWKSEPSDSTT
jgi:ParB family chromosome partitioning protein